jgi:hypothetical protein
MKKLTEHLEILKAMLIDVRKDEAAILADIEFTKKQIRELRK